MANTPPMMSTRTMTAAMACLWVLSSRFMYRRTPRATSMMTMNMMTREPPLRLTPSPATTAALTSAYRTSVLPMAPSPSE